MSAVKNQFFTCSAIFVCVALCGGGSGSASKCLFLAINKRIYKNLIWGAGKGHWGVWGTLYATTHNFVYFLGTLLEIFGHTLSNNQRAILTGYSLYKTCAYFK